MNRLLLALLSCILVAAGCSSSKQTTGNETPPYYLGAFEDFDDEEGAIRIVEDFPLDVFTRMSGHSFNDLVTYSRQHVLDNIKIPYLGVEGLILLKRKSHREKDRMDVVALRQLSEETR